MNNPYGTARLNIKGPEWLVSVACGNPTILGHDQIFDGGADGYRMTYKVWQIPCKSLSQKNIKRLFEIMESLAVVDISISGLGKVVEFQAQLIEVTQPTHKPGKFQDVDVCLSTERSTKAMSWRHQ